MKIQFNGSLTWDRTRMCFENGCNKIHAQIVGVEVSLEGLEVQTVDGKYYVFGFIKYCCTISLPFGETFNFQVEKFCQLGEKRKRNDEFMFPIGTKQIPKESKIETDEFFVFSFEFPQLSHKAFFGEAGKKCKHVDSAYYLRKVGEKTLHKIDGFEAKPFHYLTSDFNSWGGGAWWSGTSCDILLPQNLEILSQSQVDEENQRAFEIGLNEECVGWISKEIWLDRITKREGNRNLAISDGERIYIFGGEKEGVMSIDGLLEIVNNEGSHYNLLLHPEATYSEVSDADLLALGFEALDGCYFDVEYTSTLAKSLSLTNYKETDPLQLAGKKLNIPKNWIDYPNEGILSGGSVSIQFFTDFGYLGRYFAGHTKSKEGFVIVCDVYLSQEQCKQLIELDASYNIYE